MKVVQLKPKTVIYFVTFFLTGLALLYEVLKQRGVNKIKAGYLKRLTKPLHTVGVIEENKQEGYVVTGGFIHTGTGTNSNHRKTYHLDTQTKGQAYLPTVIMFHGAGFSSNTWLMLDMVEDMTKNGFRTILIDLPNHGGSDQTEPIEDDNEKVEYLNTLLGRFGLKDVVLVAPGFSGSYVLPYIFSDHRQNVRGLVTVSPDYVDHYTDDDYRNLNIPTLVFYGEYDGEGEINARRLRKIPGSQKQIIYEGTRDCYIDKPIEFKERLITFLNSLDSSA